MIKRSKYSGRAYGMLPSLVSVHRPLFKDHFKVERAGAASNTALVPFTPAACNQLQRGCCTGAGTSRAIKTRLMATDFHWKYMPSCFKIYADVRIKEGTPLDVDSGASIEDVMTVINEQGVAPEDSNPEWSWPFSASDDRWKTMPPPAVGQDALKHKIESYRLNNDLDEIKAAIDQKMPVVIGIGVYSSFEDNQTAQSGVVKMPGLWPFDQEIGGHCLYLNAYGMHDGDHIDGMNSWGGEWGDKGAFHIPTAYLLDKRLTPDIYAIKEAS